MGERTHTPGPWAVTGISLSTGSISVGQRDQRIVIADAVAACTHAIRDGNLLGDPLELRPLPLPGMPGWHTGGETEVFHRTAPCYQPLRAGRNYPGPLRAG